MRTTLPGSLSAMFSCLLFLSAAASCVAAPTPTPKPSPVRPYHVNPGTVMQEERGAAPPAATPEPAIQPSFQVGCPPTPAITPTNCLNAMKRGELSMIDYDGTANPNDPKPALYGIFKTSRSASAA